MMMIHWKIGVENDANFRTLRSTLCAAENSNFPHHLWNTPPPPLILLPPCINSARGLSLNGDFFFRPLSRLVPKLAPSYNGIREKGSHRNFFCLLSRLFFTLIALVFDFVQPALGMQTLGIFESVWHPNEKKRFSGRASDRMRDYDMQHAPK